MAARHRSNQLICDINVTGFLSVMVALLAMFLADTQPHHPLWPSVDLAKVNHPIPVRAALRDDATIVSIMHDGRIYLRNDQITARQLPTAILGPSANAKRRIFINADARCQYRPVLDVVDELHSAGVTDVTFLVDERKPLRPPL